MKQLLERLPVAPLAGEVMRALAEGPVVLTAPTGSGKSTCVPLWASRLADLPARGPQVLVVEPRRVACRSLARFLASCLGTEVGERVGYAVRHDARIEARTEVAYVTPGVALGLLRDGAIDPASVVILDEFHERGIELDLLLAVLRARAHQRLMILSATIDVDRLARHVDGAPLVADGRVFPVDVRHVGQSLVPDGRDLAERVVAALGQLAGDGTDGGDVLVFLPGKGEIAACERLVARGPFEPLPLHGELPAAAQDRAFGGGSRRRAILATNVAETSITLPTVRAVVDSGLVRRTVYREGRGALAVAAIARDSADQRAGRAGRVGPGRCLRLWHRDARLELRTPPEILREDLSRLVLWALHLGHEPEALDWLDPPRDYALAAGREVLAKLSITDGGGRLTPVGRRAARLPTDPVLARLLVAGRERGVVGDVIQLVAALSLDRPLFRAGEPAVPEGVFDEDPLTDARCDATARIIAVRQGERYRLRLREGALAEARRIAEQLRRLLGVERLPGAGVKVDREGLARAVLDALDGAAYARRVRRGRQEAWGNGRHEVRLGRDSLIDDKVETILVVDQRLLVERGRKLKRIATCCMPVTPDLLRRAGAGARVLVGVRVEGRGDGRRLVAELEWRVGTTVLGKQREVPRGPLAAEALLLGLRGERLLREEVAAARDEVEAFNLLHPAAPLDFDAWLTERVESIGFGSGEDLPLLAAADLEPGLVEPAERAEVDASFPRRLEIAGCRYRVSYEVAERRATVTGTARPKADLLPRWPGWSVRFDDGKRTVMLRS